MGFLQWLGVHHDSWYAKILPIVRQHVFCPGGSNDPQTLFHHLTGLFVIYLETFVGTGVRVSTASRKIHPPMGQYVEGGGLFGQLNGVVNRKSVYCNTETQPPCPLRRRSKDSVRCREQRKSGLAMGLGDPKSSKPESVSQLCLFEKLVEAINGRGLRSTLDLGEQANLHGGLYRRLTGGTSFMN
jgi:hypothetical protein